MYTTDKIKDDILKWSTLTDEIACRFLYDYFDDNSPEYFWVNEEFGTILNYGEFYFNFSDILTCYKLYITDEQLFNWYYFCLESESANISLAKFILSPKERKEQEEKHLAELKERVVLAQSEFNKALEKYNIKK